MRRPRLYFGPGNAGFFSSLMAREFAHRGYQTVWQLFVADRSQDDLSACLFLDRLSRPRRWKALLHNFLQLLKGADVFQFSYMASLLPHNLDLPILRALGKKVCMRYIGSDLRVDSSDPYCDAQICAFGDCDSGQSQARSRRYYRLYRWLDAHLVIDPTIFPSSRMYPTYFRQETEFHFLPSPLDVQQIPALPLPDLPITIAHIPSDRRIKGSEYVLSAFERLSREFPQVNTILLSGVSHHQLLGEFARAHIIVDQLGAPFHGITSLEAMSLGRVAVSRINAEVLEKIRALHPTYDTPVPPIVAAKPETIYKVLRDLIRRPQNLAALGQAGRRYVEQYHDAALVADRLEALYTRLWSAR